MRELNKKKGDGGVRVWCWLNRWEEKHNFGVVFLASRLPCRGRGSRLARKKQGFAINQRATEHKQKSGGKRPVLKIAKTEIL